MTEEWLRVTGNFKMSNKTIMQIIKVLSDDASPLNYGDQFQTHIAKFYLILLFVSSTLLVALYPIAKLAAIIALAPFMVIITTRLLIWNTINHKHQNTVSIKKFRRETYLTNYILCLYTGLAGAFFVTQLSAPFIFYILLWQSCTAIIMGAMGCASANKYLIRLILIFLPGCIILSLTPGLGLQWSSVFIGFITLTCFLLKYAATNLLSHIDTDKQDNTIALNRLRERLSGFFNASDDWAWECDSDFNITYISNNFDRVTGYTRKDFYGAFYDESNQSGQGFILKDKTLIKTAMLDQKRFSDVDLELITKSGNTKHYLIKGTPEFDKNDVFTGYRGWAFDTTATIKMREKLKQYDHILEEKVARRTEDLKSHVAQSNTQTQKAKNANITKTEFIRAMSHDFKAPIDNISKYTQTIRLNRNMSKQELDMATHYIDDASRNLLRMVNNISFLSALDDNTKPDEYSVVNIDGIIRAALQILSSEANKKDIKISWSALSGITIYGDYNYLAKAINEILLNAIIHSPQRANITITVDTDPKNILITITDEAPYLPFDVIQNIHEVTRTDNFNVQSKNKENVDFGLLIASKLIKRHGGHIKFNQGQEGGNIMIIHLPKVRMV